MSLRKFGTGEILPEEDDIQVKASKEDRDQVLAEVVQEQQQADEEQQ